MLYEVITQLDEIAGRIDQQNLGAAGPGHDLVAELNTAATQPLDLGGEVVDDEMDAVPAARPRGLAIGHRSPGGALGPAEQETQRAELDVSYNFV